MSALPTGQVTFLLTDIVGSAKLWEERPEAMRVALAAHDALARDLVRRHGGALVKGRGEGDSLFAVFARAGDAVCAAGALQRALLRDAAPDDVRLCLRLALHTGQADQRDGDYYGAAVNRCARLRDLAHGCQILLSQATAALAREGLPLGLGLRDLGRSTLRDLAQPEHVWQLLHPGLPEHFPPLHSPPSEAPRHNLPPQPTSFVGRAREIAQIAERLPRTPLLTLTGPGGGGKTRLAVQVAGRMVDDFPDGAWLVELAALSNPTQVAQAVAQTLRVPEGTLCDALQSRRLLLVLDNCEHLLAPCAALAQALMRDCPGVRILATSREALGAAGEVVLPVPPLGVPNLHPLPPPAQMAEYDAVKLFLARAGSVETGFALTPDNAPGIAQVCRRLDGIPLAIELAAARVKVLSVEQIAQRLDDPIPLQNGGARTVPPRQQTLRALLDWSYDLLRPEEQTLLARLSVFAGGWTLEAAERVCSGGNVPAAQVLAQLGRLVDKSLVRVDGDAGANHRYGLFGMVRHYGRERLALAGEEGDVRTRHRAWLLSLAEDGGAEQPDVDPALWLDCIEAERDNFRAVLEDSLVEEDGGEACLRLAGALWPFWFVRGHRAEGRQWLERALALGGGATADRARALRGASALAWGRGDGEEARALAQESLIISERIGDERGTAHALQHLGLASRHRGDWGAARALLENSLSLFRALRAHSDTARLLCRLGELAWLQGDNERARTLQEESLRLSHTPGRRRDRAYSLVNLGSVALAEGRSDTARSLLEESLAVFRGLGEPWAIAYAQWGLGNVALATRQWKDAHAQLAEALRLVRDLGSRWSQGFALESLGHLAAAQGRWERAARLTSAAQTLRDSLHCPLPPVMTGPHQARLDAARAHMGEDAFRAAWGEGRTLSLAAAVEEGLAAGGETRALTRARG